MIEIISLSDSDDSTLSIENDKQERKNSTTDPLSGIFTSNDFDFPEIKFDYASVNSELRERWKNTSDSTLRSLKTSNECNVQSTMSNLSSKSTSNSDFNIEDVLLMKYSCLQSTSHLPESRSKKQLTGSSLHESQELSSDKSNEKSNKTKKVTGRDKDKVKAERLKTQEEATKQKALKVIAAKNAKSVQPGECIKFMEVIVDNGITNFTFYSELLVALQNIEIMQRTESQQIPNSITWRRNAEEYYMNESNEVSTRTQIHDENQMILIWNWDEVVKKVVDRSLCTSVAHNRALLPDKNITLVIYGMESYFKYHRNLKKRRVKDEVLGIESRKGTSKQDKTFGKFPRISRQELELCLTEIQITVNCNSRLIENPRDMGFLICQYTKAIAEIPFKLNKRQMVGEKVDWYVVGDNKDTVQVDKDGNGLKKLWLQQLCQFNLASLEIAEAICSVYTCPVQLMEAYMNCTPVEGKTLLKDIPIRRAAGPLTSVRKIGPEMSKKIYIMFTSENGETLLGDA